MVDAHMPVVATILLFYTLIINAGYPASVKHNSKVTSSEETRRKDRKEVQLLEQDWKCTQWWKIHTHTRAHARTHTLT